MDYVKLKPVLIEKGAKNKPSKLSIPYRSELDRLTGRAKANLARRHRLKYCAARANYCIRTNANIGPHKAVSGHPCPVFYHNFSCDQAKARIADIVTAGTEVAFLRNDAVTANFNRCQTIEHRVVTHPAVVADFNIPRIGKASRWSNNDLLTNFGAKPPQQPTANPMSRMQCQRKHYCLH